MLVQKYWLLGCLLNLDLNWRMIHFAHCYHANLIKITIVMKVLQSAKKQLCSIIKVYSNNVFYLKDFNWWKNKGYVGNGIKTTQNHQIVWLQIKKARHAFLHALWHPMSCHDMISHCWRLATMWADDTLGY
jgi:hypothetical protein